MFSPYLLNIYYTWQRQKTFCAQWTYLVHSVLNFGLGGFLIHYSVDIYKTNLCWFLFYLYAMITMSLVFVDDKFCEWKCVIFLTFSPF